MDGACAVAVVTTNWPFARIYNDFPSAAALKGAGTLAGSNRIPPHHHHTHTYSNTVEAYMVKTVKPEDTNTLFHTQTV